MFRHLHNRSRAAWRRGQTRCTPSSRPVTSRTIWTSCRTTGRVILAADAVMTRAELRAAAGVRTRHGTGGSAAIMRIRDRRRGQPGAIPVCGHGLPPVKDSGDGACLDTRHANILGWFVTSRDNAHLIDPS